MTHSLGYTYMRIGRAVMAEKGKEKK